ncbi:MAG TPA: phosphatase PAP2 family protein [Anaerolineaceae bacterium]
MKAASSNSQIWLECLALAGLSGLLAVLMNKGFARYKPVAGPPKVQPGDTPAAPWQMPKPEEKAQAEPVRQALEQATAQIDTPEKADQAAQKLEELAGSATNGDVEQAKKPQQPGTVSERVAESSQRVEQAAAPEGSSSGHPAEVATAGSATAEAAATAAAQGIAQATKEAVTSSGREREAIAEATQETLNPDQQGAPEAAHPQQRKYLRQAVLKRMKPWDALDAELFLAINHLPHNRWLNGFFYFFTFTFSAGLGWYLVLAGLALVGKPRRSLEAASQTILPLSVATMTVEYPIKTFFRRRRPFIDVIQATVIGKKPGSWSFPSGHSAGAFAGASLISRYYPHQRPFLYLIAALVAFSRIYLGDHYPGDVLSGSLSGMGIAHAVQKGQDAVMKD